MKKVYVIFTQENSGDVYLTEYTTRQKIGSPIEKKLSWSADIKSAIGFASYEQCVDVLPFLKKDYLQIKPIFLL